MPGVGGIAVYRSCEVFDSTTGQWTAAADMSVTRMKHAAARLPDGRVLVTGGDSVDMSGHLATSEIYDPTLDAWSPAAPMSTTRERHHAILLQDGRVFVLGADTAEAYSPTGDIWTPLPPPPAVHGARTVLVELPTGDILAVGGGDETSGLSVSRMSAFHPGSNTWTALPPMQAQRRDHTATLLTSGSVLVVGGVDAFGDVLATAEIYTTGSGWTTLPAPGPRNRHAAIRLLDGGILIVGGSDGATWEDTILIFDSDTRVFAETAMFGNNWARLRPGIGILPEGHVIVAGGAATESVDWVNPLDAVDVYEAAP